MIREILDTEMEQLLELYTHLHDNAMPQKTKELLMLWESVMKDKNYHIIIIKAIKTNLKLIR